MAEPIKTNETVVENGANIRTLQMQQMNNVNAYNRMSGEPYYGLLDKNGEVRLRLAMIDNPEIQRDPYQPINPLDVENVINMDNGKIVLRWLDIPGGAIRPSGSNEEWVYYPDRDKEIQDPDSDNYRNGTEWEISSAREMVDLTSPFIWANDENYCGMNFIPPVGSIVVVGFKKQNLPVILGYVPTRYQICKPYLRPGEVLMKGYGNNYIHWKQEDQLFIKAWSVKNEKNLDTGDVNQDNNTLWIRLNANTGKIELIAKNDENKSKINLTPSECQIEGKFKINDGYYEETINALNAKIANLENTLTQSVNSLQTQINSLQQQINNIRN